MTHIIDVIYFFYITECHLKAQLIRDQQQHTKLSKIQYFRHFSSYHHHFFLGYFYQDISMDFVKMHLKLKGEFYMNVKYSFRQKGHT